MLTGDGSGKEEVTESLDDGAAFTDLFERHLDDIYRYLAFRVGEVMAEDLVAETFARAFAGRRRSAARSARSSSSKPQRATYGSVLRSPTS